MLRKNGETVKKNNCEFLNENNYRRWNCLLLSVCFLLFEFPPLFEYFLNFLYFFILFVEKVKIWFFLNFRVRARSKTWRYNKNHWSCLIVDISLSPIGDWITFSRSSTSCCTSRSDWLLKSRAILWLIDYSSPDDPSHFLSLCLSL